MDTSQAQRLGQHLRTARHAAGLSAVRLSHLTDITDATIIRIEQGKFATVAAERLGRIAHALGIDLAEVYQLAGIPTPELPDLDIYIEQRYGPLPEDARNKLDRYLRRLITEHGMHPGGPEPGADEASPSAPEGNK